MILSKIELTPQEIKDQADLWAQAEEKLNQHTEVMREIKGTEKGKKPSVEAIKKSEELISSANELFRQIDAIKGKAEQRYIDSFKGDTDAILRDAEQIINLIEAKDYYKDLERKKRLYADYLAKAPSKDAPKEEKERYKRTKKSIKRCFDTYCYFMYVCLRVQLNALTLYGMSQEDIEASIGKVIEDKAGELYSRPSTTQHVIIEAEKAPYFGPGFNTIRQGVGTNALARIDLRTGPNDEDRIKHTTTFKNGSLMIQLPWEQLNFRTSTRQLLDAINIKLTESGTKEPTVVLSLAEYMKARGLKDRKEANKQVIADLDVLTSMKIKWIEPGRKDQVLADFINLADRGTVIKGGDIIFTFSNTFYNLLRGYPVMPYPDALQKINSHKNPNSYYLLRKISEHKNMNIGKSNEDTIAVKTLLEACPNIPTYEEVMKSGKHLDQRIIKPFERDMDALKDTLTWAYSNSRGQPLTDKQLAMPYSVFKDLQIKITWKAYPDTSKRLEAKKEKAESAKKKKSQKKN